MAFPSSFHLSQTPGCVFCVGRSYEAASCMCTVVPVSNTAGDTARHIGGCSLSSGCTAARFCAPSSAAWWSQPVPLINQRGPSSASHVKQLDWRMGQTPPTCKRKGHGIRAPAFRRLVTFAGTRLDGSAVVFGVSTYRCRFGRALRCFIRARNIQFFRGRW